MAKWSFAAVGRNDQSAGRRRGYFDALATCGNHLALERSVAGGRLPSFARTGLRIARSVCAGRHSEKRDRQGRRSRRLEIYRAGTLQADASVGLGGACRSPASERERKPTLRRRREEPGRRTNRSPRSKIE